MNEVHNKDAFRRPAAERRNDIFKDVPPSETRGITIGVRGRYILYEEERL